jgi:hypothetical protein
MASLGLPSVFGAPHVAEMTDERVESPKLPGQESPMDTREKADKVPEIKRELPMFLGGGPF